MPGWANLSRGGKIGVVAVGAGGLYLGVRWWRNRAAAGAASSSSVTGGATAAGSGYSNDPGQGIPTGTFTTPGGLSYSGPIDPSTLSTLIGGSPPGAVATPGPTTPNVQQITIGGANPGLYDILGQVTGAAGAPNNYAGANVGGGAPVYFGNGNGVAQGSQAIQPGAFAYTPAGNESLITAPSGPETIK